MQHDAILCHQQPSTEADLGMFSMFGRTGVPQKHKLPDSCCCNSSVHCSTGRQQNFADDPTVHVRWRQSEEGIHILGAPHFFLNEGPARSKSGPDRASTPHRRYACLRHYSTQPDNDLNLRSLTLRTFSAMPSHMMNICFIEIPSLNKQISRHAKYVLTDDGRTAGRHTRKLSASAAYSAKAKVKIINYTCTK